MGNIANIRSKVRKLFNERIITDQELDVIISFLIDEFSMIVPELRSILIDRDNTCLSGNMLYIDCVDYIISIIGYTDYVNVDNVMIAPGVLLDDIASFELMRSMLRRLRHTFVRPPVLDGTDGRYIILHTVPVILFYHTRRRITYDLYEPIRADVYSVLDDYIMYRIIDISMMESVNFSIENMLDLKDKLSNYISSQVSDSTNISTLSSISLGGLSISWSQNRVGDTLYSSIGRIAEFLSSISERQYRMLERLRDEKRKSFLRKRNSMSIGYLISML